MYRLGQFLEGSWVEYSHPPVFQLMRTDSNIELLKIGVPGGDIAVAQALLRCLDGPFYVLYVLVVPRGEGDTGRYQSPLVDWDQVDALLNRFQDYLRSDGRFHLWFHDPAARATIVWDRHNIIYAYGPLAEYERCLSALGFQNGLVRIPAPHEHHYRNEFDIDARAMLAHFDWRHSDLQPSDDD